MALQNTRSSCFTFLNCFDQIYLDYLEKNLISISYSDDTLKSPNAIKLAGINDLWK